MLRSNALALRFAVPFLFAMSAVACGAASDDDSAPKADDEGALATANDAKGPTVLLTPKADDGSRAELSFALRDRGGKRVATMAIARGDKHAELDCSQLANLNADAKKDEIVTVCEEQTQPGSVYVSVYVRFFPGTKKLSMDVIASNPTELTRAQRDLYTLVSGLAVVTPPPPRPHGQYVSHREEHDDLALTAKRMGSDPFGDPIALAAAARDGLRGPLGRKAHDTKGSHPGDFTISKLTAYSSFADFTYPFDVQGQSADQSWHYLSGFKVGVATSGGAPALVSAADVADRMREAVGTF